MEQLTLTSSEVKALLFVGGRYMAGDHLLETLLGHACSQDENLDYDIATEKGFTVRLDDFLRAEIYTALKEDTEGFKTSHPLLSRGMVANLTEAYGDIEERIVDVDFDGGY